MISTERGHFTCTCTEYAELKDISVEKKNITLVIKMICFFFVVLVSFFFTYIICQCIILIALFIAP